MISTNNKVSSAVVLPDDGVPNSFTGTTHAHSKRQETKYRHTVGVSGQEGLVDTDTGEVVDITGLGETDNGVDENVSLAGTGSADSEFSVRTVHGVPGGYY